jgi:hypothetical protein
LSRSKFQEWTLFGVNDAGKPQYLKIGSIRPYGDRVAFQARFLADPNAPLIGTTKFPVGTFGEHTIVIDCKQSIMAVADVKAVSPSGQILGAYKWAADPELLNLSFGQAITPGQVAVFAKNIVCNDKLRTPLVDKEQLSSMSFSDLASTTNGDGEIYYQTVQSDGVPKGQRDVIVVIQQITALKVASVFGPALKLDEGVDLGTYKTGVFWDRFQCQASKVSALKSEFYDESNELKLVSIADLSKELTWSEFADQSPYALLQRIVCPPREVQQ